MTKESVLFLHAYLMTDIKNYKSFFHFNMNAYKSVFNIVIRVVLLGGVARYWFQTELLLSYLNDNQSSANNDGTETDHSINWLPMRDLATV